MNDPGLDEPAQEAAKHVDDNVYEEDRKKAEYEEQDFLDPTTWWFASTALSSAPPGKPGVELTGAVPVDRRLIAVNSISLVLALVANMALLLNMTRRISFTIAQPVTIVGWFLSSFLLIALVAVASTSIFRIQPLQEHALSQAYYYGLMAAGLYFIIASLMCLTVYGAYKGHYPKEFRLTPSQRTLMLQTISFVVYLLLGALVFSIIEGWAFLDAVHWADFTLLTIGIGGEFVPRTHTGRTLVLFYAFGGITMVGLVVGSVRSLILERGKQKMSARFLETKRQKVLATIDEEERTIKLGYWEKITFSEKGLSETQRREQEFRVMRRVQKKAERNRRYTALAMSTTAALLLWFLGALVWSHSEKPQGWSYFVSLYFAYTTLMTIGYGDYTPSSNAGKAFFVFWTLLAVPTLTILISNMGDTVIKAFKDLTLWFGSLTVLPGEHGIGETLKIGFQRLKHGDLYNEDEENEKGITSRGASDQRIMDRLTKHIEEQELGEAEEAGEHGDELERDIHFYHFVLAKEVRQLLKDVNASPPKEYSYEEWCYYLRLVGQDEDDASGHRKPRIDNNRDRSPRSQPDLGVADEGGSWKWSWLGVRSPLMGNKSEAEWLLQRLSATLEMEMGKMWSKDENVRKEKPPISMADLRGDKNVEKNPEQALKGDVVDAQVKNRGKGEKEDV